MSSAPYSLSSPHPGVISSNKRKRDEPEQYAPNRLLSEIIKSLPKNELDSILVAAAIGDFGILKRVRMGFSRDLSRNRSQNLSWEHLNDLDRFIQSKVNDQSGGSDPGSSDVQTSAVSPPIPHISTLMASSGRCTVHDRGNLCNAMISPHQQRKSTKSPLMIREPAPIEAKKSRAKSIPPQIPEVLSFDQCTDDVYNIVNEEPGARNGFKKKYGIAYREFDAIQNIIDHGVRAKISQDSHFETKLDALNNLIQIGLVIMGAVPSELAKETRNGQAPRKITDGMAEIIVDMTEEEIDMLWKSEGWIEDMAELKEEGSCYFEKKMGMVDYEIDDIVELCRPDTD